MWDTSVEFRPRGFLTYGDFAINVDFIFMFKVELVGQADNEGQYRLKVVTTDADEHFISVPMVKAKALEEMKKCVRLLTRGGHE